MEHLLEYQQPKKQLNRNCQDLLPHPWTVLDADKVDFVGLIRTDHSNLVNVQRTDALIRPDVGGSVISGAHVDSARR